MMGRNVINSGLWGSAVSDVSGEHPLREKISPPGSSLETCLYVHGCRLTDGDQAALAGLSEYTEGASATSTTWTRGVCPRNFSALTSTDLRTWTSPSCIHTEAFCT